MLPFAEIPISVLAFFIGFLAITGLGIRSYIRYRSLKAPLVYYFSLTGLTFGAGLFFYSVPFMFNLGESLWKVAFMFGDAFIFLGLIVTAQILWYVQLHKFIRSRWGLLVPVILIALASWSLNTYYTLTQATVAIVDGQLLYQLPLLGLALWAALYLLMVAVGAYMLRQAKLATESSARIRSVSLGAVYIVAGLGGVYNNLFFGGQVDPAVALAYVAAFAIFLVTLVTINLRKAKNPPPIAPPPSN